MEIMKEALLRHLDRARQSLWDPNKNEHRFGTGFIDPQQIQSAKVVMGAQGARPGQRPNGIDMVLTVPGDELSYNHKTVAFLESRSILSEAFYYNCPMQKIAKRDSRNDCVKLVGISNRKYAMEIGTAAVQLLRMSISRFTKRNSSGIEKLITKRHPLDCSIHLRKAAFAPTGHSRLKDIRDQLVLLGWARAVLVLVYAGMWTVVIFLHIQPVVAPIFQPLYK
ncbi:hypothetical protein EV421DRAFT_2022856 [Armillaria borealis]|uniref:Uncharacterized protein n=1 Tax=Armillaria borealis TaxID=47425 RepID=A0AA39J3Q3_9AGAR|nr:hypothetical protein EV421DRAFT_2022856 [Armillaria borealis]